MGLLSHTMTSLNGLNGPQNEFWNGGKGAAVTKLRNECDQSIFVDVASDSEI